jgi:3'-5' exoribonuclease 1
MNYIILDLEATCWKQKGKFQSEIIEIGALCINENKEILDEYCSFVKPIINPILSEFCTKLTTIEQQDIDVASEYPKVLSNFQDWILSYGANYWLCSWGFYDRSQFKKDCQLHRLDATWLRQHISLKHQYGDVHSLPRPISMKDALKREGFELQGTHHRGIDDARNIAQVFLKNFDAWTLNGHNNL